MISINVNCELSQIAEKIAAETGSTQEIILAFIAPISFTPVSYTHLINKRQSYRFGF